MKYSGSLCLFLCALWLSFSARADVFVVVSVASPLRALGHKDVQSLYMGRRRLVAAAEEAVVYDLPRNHPLRDEFYAVLTGWGAAQVNSYWSRLIFTGQVLPPLVLPDEQAMVERVKRDARAIGYLGREPGDVMLRTVYVLRPQATATD